MIPTSTSSFLLHCPRTTRICSFLLFWNLNLSSVITNRLGPVRTSSPSYRRMSRAMSNSVNLADVDTTSITAPQTSIDKPADLIESAKRRAAIRAVEDYFEPSMRYVGIGSGTTIQYVVEAIKERCTDPRILFVPTGYQSRTEVEKRGLTAISFDSLPEDVMLDVAFDGADEVDEEFNCVKGGGACLFQEKLVATRAKKFVCVADFRKDVPRLLTAWPYIPIEVAPIAVKTVLKSLRALGCPNPSLRTLSVVKAGPLKTDQDFFIVKAPFPPLLMEKDRAEAAENETTMGLTTEKLEAAVWDVNSLATKIKAISGVLEVGLFHGFNGPEAMRMGVGGGQKPVAVYFGMEDGSVKVRKAPGERE